MIFIQKNTSFVQFFCCFFLFTLTRKRYIILSVQQKDSDKMVTDMSKGTPWRVLLNFSLPLLLSAVFQQLYNMADTVIAGRSAKAPLRR